MNLKIPEKIVEVINGLKKAGFEAYLVGGVVRDLLRGMPPEPMDNWDITTNAIPEQIQKIFPDSFYENKFGTVSVIIKGEEKLLVEVTPYRIEGKYSDKRRPDEIKFAKTIFEDLSRRDFTINAIALDINESGFLKRIIDPHQGQEDLKKKIIKTVGEPKERFSEDALRLLRAVRFATLLNFKIEGKTYEALKQNATNLQEISPERIRDEFIKIIMSPRAAEGIFLLEESGLLQYIIPELREGINCLQSPPHRYDVFKHSVLSLKKASEMENATLAVRLAALLHDIGKPRTRQVTSERITFYGHQVVGAKMAREILHRLKFPKEIIEKVYKIVLNHMFFYDVGKVNESAIRRLIMKMGGVEQMRDLMAVRIADRKGTPVPKEKPYKLRHFEYMIEKVSADPIHVSQLEIDGNEVMEALKIAPGPRVGLILNALLAEVLDDPQKNKKEILLKRAQALNKLSDEELKIKKYRIEREIYERDQLFKEKHWVK